MSESEELAKNINSLVRLVGAFGGLVGYPIAFLIGAWLTIFTVDHAIQWVVAHWNWTDVLGVFAIASTMVAYITWQCWR